MADNHLINQNQYLANLPAIASDPFFLFIEEVIDYSLRHHKIDDWNLPVSLQDARSMADYTYFSEDIAVTVVSPQTESQALKVAKSLNFNEDEWLRFTDYEEAGSYLEYYLLKVFEYHDPHLSEMFSLGCYAIRIAIQTNQYRLASVVVWALLSALRMICTPEEYYKLVFEHNVHNDQLNDTDEGLGGIRDEDDIHFVSERRLFWISTDPILLFVEELVDFSLRGSDLPGRFSTIDFETLQRAEVRLFTVNLGIAINHSFISNEAVSAAQERGFEKERWLDLHGSFEARNFQHYFLRQVFNFGGNKSVLRMLSFASYSSRLAMQRNRKDLVNEVVSALSHFLYNYYSYPQQYREIDAYAKIYNRFHHTIHAQSDDEGVGDVQDEVADSDENNADFFEGEAAAPTEGEGDETEERSDSQSLQQ